MKKIIFSLFLILVSTIPVHAKELIKITDMAGIEVLISKKVYTLFPNNFYRTNLEIMIANAYFIGKIVYPQNFKDIDIRKKAKEIFEKFIGRDIYDELKSGFKGYGKVEFRESGISVN